MAGDRTESRVAEDDERFLELLAELDAIARDAALAPVEHRFRQNDKALAAMLSQDRSEHRARFSLDGGLRVARLSPLAVSQLNLRPGQAFDVPGEAMEVLRRVRDGTVQNGLVSVPLGPYGKPVLIELTRLTSDRIEAMVLSLPWPPIAETALRDRFSLSDAEADIAHLIFEGATPKGVARARDRSVETVRKQIRTLLRKTGARGLTDLLHILYSFVAAAEQASQTGPWFSGRTMVRLRGDTVYDVEITGPETGRPLVFLHGALGGRTLHPAALAELSGHRIIAPGRPFHGQSRSGGPEGTVQASVAGDLIEVLDHLDVDPRVSLRDK